MSISTDPISYISTPHTKLKNINFLTNIIKMKPEAQRQGNQNMILIDLQFKTLILIFNNNLNIDYL